MGFSLIGLLVSVGVVLWLGSQAFDATTSTPGPSSAASAGSITTMAPLPGLDVFAEPSTDLTDDASITVSAANLLPGEPVVVVACVGAMDSIPGDPGSCDPATESSTTASAAGKIEVRFAMPRVVRAGGLPIDCAQEGGRCEVRVRGLDSALGGNASVSFADGLDQAELLEGLDG